MVTLWLWQWVFYVDLWSASQSKSLWNKLLVNIIFELSPSVFAVSEYLAERYWVEGSPVEINPFHQQSLVEYAAVLHMPPTGKLVHEEEDIWDFIKLYQIIP